MSAITATAPGLPCPRRVHPCGGPARRVELRFPGARQVYEKLACVCGAETLPRARADRLTAERRARADARARERRDPFPDGPAPWAR